MVIQLNMYVESIIYQEYLFGDGVKRDIDFINNILYPDKYKKFNLTPDDYEREDMAHPNLLWINLINHYHVIQMLIPMKK